jgi:hypothetical protein
MKYIYLLDILIIFTNIFNFRFTMRFKCKATTKKHLIDVMGKWFNLFVNQNHFQIMNSYKCVEKIKNSIYVCRAFCHLFILNIIYIFIESLSPFS